MKMILINNKKFNSFKFPGGEIHLNLNDLKDDFNHFFSVGCWINTSDDLMELLLCIDAIRRMWRNAEISLTVPYLPYARQDRVCNEGEPLSIKIMADIINNLNVDQLNIFDPHSEVSVALLNNCRVILPETYIEDYPDIFKDKILISPDAGAYKKTIRISQYFDGLPIVKADKIRDVKTGEIRETQVFCESLNGLDVLIIDDICDGGRTFIELAKKLKGKNAGKISLYVSHGIFSKGLDVFKGLIDKIYTTNSYNYEIKETDLLKVIKFREHLL
jgi:ribose-phosphate pyrophosphokinase